MIRLQELVATVEALPDGQQEEVLSLARQLLRDNPPRQPHRGAEGLWADLGIDITEEDVAAIRKEMWANFPRGFPE